MIAAHNRSDQTPSAGPAHHPSEATLLAYAAGALSETLSVVVAAHLAFCRDCRDAVAAGETIGGGLLDEVTPEMVAPAARERMLARLDEPAPPRPALHETVDPLVPAPLGHYLARPLATQRWRLLAPGLGYVKLQRGPSGGNLSLLRLGAGRSLTRHGHRGTELTLVLSGAFHDASGHFQRGDVAEHDGEDGHQPCADPGSDCICVVATEGRLVFNGFIGRLVQRLTRF